MSPKTFLFAVCLVYAATSLTEGAVTFCFWWDRACIERARNPPTTAAPETTTAAAAAETTTAAAEETTAAAAEETTTAAAEETTTAAAAEETTTAAAEETTTAAAAEETTAAAAEETTTAAADDTTTAASDDTTTAAADETTTAGSDACSTTASSGAGLVWCRLDQVTKPEECADSPNIGLGALGDILGAMKGPEIDWTTVGAALEGTGITAEELGLKFTTLGSALSAGSTDGAGVEFKPAYEVLFG